jgi:hypothetical protein
MVADRGGGDRVSRWLAGGHLLLDSVHEMLWGGWGRGPKHIACWPRDGGLVTDRAAQEYCHTSVAGATWRSNTCAI